MVARERRQLLVVLAAAAMLASIALAYAPARRAPFLWDDHVLVEQDSRWREASLGALFTEPFLPKSPLIDVKASYYRPLVLLSFRADAALGGTPVEFHFTNVLLHLVACALLATVAWRLGATGPASVTAALAWGLAPRLTEAVAWISGRTDVLAGAFVLAALAVSPDVVARPPPRSARAWVASGLTGALVFAALASKEVAVAGVAALVVAAVLPRADDEPGHRHARARRLFASAGAPLLVYLALRTIALAGTPSRLRAPHAGTVLEAVARYAAMTLDAWRPRTSIGVVGEVPPGWAAAGAVVLLALAGLAFVAWRARRRLSPGVFIGGSLALSSAALVVHVLPLDISSAVAADRLLYVPLAGVALAAAVASRGLARARAVVLGGAVLASAYVSSLVTFARAQDYTDEARFWIVAAEHAEDGNTAPRNALAGIMRDDGRRDLACALYASASAIEARAGRGATVAHRRTREHLAGCLAKTGRYDDARALFDELAREYPRSGRVLMGRGYLRLHVLDFDGATRDLSRALELDPRLGPYVTAALSELQGARAAARRFASAEARDANRLAYAEFLALVGRLPDAEREYLALALDPRAEVAARGRSLTFLAIYGQIPAARRAHAALAASPVASQLVFALRFSGLKLAPRAARFDRAARFEPRVAHLLASR